MDRPRMTFDFVLAQVHKFKQLPKQPSRTWRHKNLIRFCDMLQPCRQVGRFANQREFSTGAYPDQVTHDHKSGRNADTHLDSRRAGERQFRYSFYPFEGGLNRALGVVLMRGRKSKIGKNPVAHVAGDVAVETVNRVLTTSLERAQDLAQILWVQARGKRARTNHVEKKHCNISPLGLNAARLRKRLLQTRQLRHKPLPSRKLLSPDLYSIILHCMSPRQFSAVRWITFV